MQSYPINIAPGETRVIQTTAQRFVYESGAATLRGGDARIVVKPDNGADIVLRPGQSFKLPGSESAAVWSMRALDPAMTITGAVIIGSGEFEDNSFKIDANSGAVPVNITSDGGVVKTTGAYVALQKSWIGGTLVTGVDTEVVAPSANVYGAVINKMLLQRGNSGGSDYYTFAKAPNGDKLFLNNLIPNTAAGAELMYEDITQYELPAGWGLYLRATGASPQPGLKCIAYTLK